MKERRLKIDVRGRMRRCEAVAGGWRCGGK
jgi:hypothetical protein